MLKESKLIAAVILSLAIVISCTFLGKTLTDPATYSHTIEVLDENRSTVLTLSAAAAATSTVISALPDDMGTPIAEKLADFSGYFLLILSAIYLEKYLLTILGAAACYLLIPVGCALLLIYLFFPVESLRAIAPRIVALGVALMLVIPTSVWVSDRINDIYEDSIQLTVSSVGALSDSLTEEPDANAQESSSLIDRARQMVDSVPGSVSAALNQVKTTFSRFVEALAVMIVTACLIPLAVLLFFLWILKILFGVQIKMPPPHLHKM